MYEFSANIKNVIEISAEHPQGFAGALATLLPAMWK